MAKVKSQFPVGSFIVSVSGDGQGIVHLRYFINGRYVKKSTGIKIDRKMWDSKNQKLKGSNVPKINNISNQKNEMLQEMKMKFDKQIRDYDGLLTYEVVTSILNGDLNTREKQIKEIDFIEYCQKLYRNKLDQGRIAYSYWFNKSLTPLFEGIKSLYENCLIEPIIYSSIYGKYESTRKTIYEPKVKDQTIRYLTPEQLEQFVEIYNKTKS